jgi:DNA-binding response OmpR family regulator
MRSLLIQLFRADFNVVCVYNATNALEWMQKNPTPSLIISDILMPEMDGFEFLETIRNSKRFGHIPCVVLSGLDKSQDRVKCLELGADDFMTKPFNPSELHLKVSRLIKNVYYESQR